MKPLEEYMLFTRTEAEHITVYNSQGVRSAQCNTHFEDFTSVIQEPTHNVSMGPTKNWNMDPPKRVTYLSNFQQRNEKDDKTQVVFTILTAFFIVIIVCCLIEVYRTDRAYKKRIERETDEGIIWSREQASKILDGGKTYKPVRVIAVFLSETFNQLRLNSIIFRVKLMGYEENHRISSRLEY